MAIVYVDTSVWVAVYGAENSGANALEWLKNADLQRVAISDWITTEFSSALAMKKRRGEVTENDWEQAHQEFDHISHQLPCLSINTVDYMKAAAMCRDAKSNLRASDALHLAIALRHNCKAMFSFDHVLKQQAQKQGLALIEV